MIRTPSLPTLVVISLFALAQARAHAQGAPSPATAAPPATAAAPASTKAPAAADLRKTLKPANSAAPTPPSAAPGAPAAVLQVLQAKRAAWNKPSAPFQIIGNIYYVGTDGLASYLITTPKGHFLLDTALPEAAPQIEQNIQTLGFKLSDIKFLLNSHAHYDHSGAMARLKSSTGAQVISSEGDKSALEGGFYLGSENEHVLDSVPVKVDRTVKDGESLTLGGTTLKANLTPGHTRGCTSWSMPVQDAGKSYQVLFFCSATVAANRLVGPPQYDGIVADYEKTFARGKTLKVDVLLAPHPEFFAMREKQAKLGKSPVNPFVNPGEFVPFLSKMESDFRSQLAQQKTAAQGGSQVAADAPPAAPSSTPPAAPSSTPPVAPGSPAAPAPPATAATRSAKPQPSPHDHH